MSFDDHEAQDGIARQPSFCHIRLIKTQAERPC
jgi:hypothetical protein